jgi:flotillin
MPGFHTTGPNQALVISGGGKQPKIVVGGRAFVIPILQRVQTLSLEVMTLNPQTNKVYTKEGVAVSVDGVAQVKVGSSEESIRVAAQQFLGKTPNEIAEVALQTVEGNQRSILGTMSVEEIYQDRDGFATQVREVADTDMSRMGLEIVSFTIRDIQDEQGYLEALGIGWTAEVKRDALIAQAEADRDSSIRSAAADQEAQAARFAADTAIAESERDFNIQKASYDRESNARLAEAELAYQLQAAKTQKDIREQEMQVEVIKRQKQIEVQQQEVYRKEQELEATVRRPANAERDQLETVAAGNRARVIAEAEAEAEAIRVRGHAEAIRAKGLAEAEAMDRKAAAWKEYGQAALIEQLFDRLPEVAAAISAPLAKTEKIVMISGGGNGESGGIGASRLTRDITSIMAELPSVVEALTGTDILSTLKNLAEFNLKNGSDDNQQLPDSETDASPLK